MYKRQVKDIVEECQITRQAFYYHFEGIPDLIQWSIKQGTRRLLEACKEQGGAEAALKYLFVFAINAIPEVRKGIESNYGKELEQTLMQGTYELFESKMCIRDRISSGRSDLHSTSPSCDSWDYHAGIDVIY